MIVEFANNGNSLASILSAVAIILAGVGLIMAALIHFSKLRKQEINISYKTYEKLVKLFEQNPTLGYLFWMKDPVIPDNHLPHTIDSYEEKILLAKKIISSKIETDHGYTKSLYLQEEAVARIIFSEFSHVYHRFLDLYQGNRKKFWVFKPRWKEFENAVENGKITGAKNKKLLKGTITYFLGHVLRNPRLLYHWHESGGNLKRHFYGDTERFYKEYMPEYVLESPEVDWKGPFDSDFYDEICDVDVAAPQTSLEAKSNSKYQTRWEIESKFPLTPEQKEDVWAKAYEDAQGGFVSVAVDNDFKKKLFEEIEKLKDVKKILLVGCGVEGAIENEIARMFPKSLVECGDFPKVVEQVQADNKEPNVKYIPLDTTELDAEEEYDLIINLDTVASENHQENKQMMYACNKALTAAGLYIGTFSSAFAWTDIAYLEDEFKGRKNGRMDLVDLHRSSILKVSEPGKDREGNDLPEVWRIYYTPLRLRYLLKETGFNLQKMELYFCDSSYFAEAADRDYEIHDPDLPLYDHYVVATKAK